MPNITKETYQKYLSMGWSVIPWKLIDDGDGKVSKRPAIDSWREFQHRIATNEELDQWDGRYNAIAVVTGKISNLTIVDVDTHNEASLSFNKLDSEIVVSSAFSGGKHYYFEYTPAGRTTSKLDNAPVDMRSDGGVIILPPSNLNGREYRFDKLGPVFSLSTVPEDIIKAIETKKKELSIPIGDEFPILSGVGDRNETAARLAGSLFARVDYGLGEEVIWPALEHWNATKVNPPLDAYSLRRTYESIRDAHARNHPDLILTPNDFLLPKSLDIVAQQRAAEHELEKNAPRTGFTGLDQLIKGFLPGHTYAMTGETNIGKTAMCCNFATNVAETGRKVLYFALEPGNNLVDYLASIKYKDTFDNTRDKIFGLSKNIEVFTDGVRSIDELKLIIRKLSGYDLIVIDHISYFIKSGENYVQEQSNSMKELNLFAKEMKTAILFVAHINKQSSTKKEIDMNSISGSAAFKQDSTEVLLLTRDKENIYEGNIVVAKTKAGPNGKCPLVFNPNSAYVSEGGSF